MEEKGLVVISVTDEETALVNDFVAEFGVTHPLVILKGGELESLIGVQGFPTSAVFTNGVMTWTGHPSESGSAVSGALKQTSKGSIYPKALTKVRSLMRADRPAEAYAEILKGEPKYSADDAPWAARVKLYIEQQAAGALESAKADLAAGFVSRGVGRVAPYGGEASALPLAAEINAWLLQIQTDTPNYAKEVAGGAAFEKAEAMEKQELFSEAFDAYKAMLGKYKETRIGAHAEESARAILEGGKAGFNPNCEKCDGKYRRACSKHLEKKKL